MVRTRIVKGTFNAETLGMARAQVIAIRDDGARKLAVVAADGRFSLELEASRVYALAFEDVAGGSFGALLAGADQRRPTVKIKAGPDFDLGNVSLLAPAVPDPTNPMNPEEKPEEQIPGEMPMGPTDRQKLETQLCVEIDQEKVENVMRDGFSRSFLVKADNDLLAANEPDPTVHRSGPFMDADGDLRVDELDKDDNSDGICDIEAPEVPETPPPVMEPPQEEPPAEENKEDDVPPPPADEEKEEEDPRMGGP